MEDAHLWQAYAWPQRSLRVNFVVSLDGHIAGHDGLSAPLSSPEDRRILSMLRSGCDALVVGAGTLRSESYGPMQLKPQWDALRGDRPVPPLFAVSASGNVPDIPGLQVITEADIPRVKEMYPRVLCEGGPVLFTSLLGAGLVDELALSISGQFGGSGSLLTDAVTARARPKHVHSAETMVFTLWDIT